MALHTGRIVPYRLMKIIIRDGRIRLAGKEQQKTDHDYYEDDKT